MIKIIKEGTRKIADASFLMREKILKKMGFLQITQ